MDVVFFISRLLFVVLFLTAGWAHLRHRAAMIEYARSQRAPLPEVLVPATGLMMLAGAVMVAAGIAGDLGALLLAAFVGPTAVLMHAFWREQDPGARSDQQSHFNKNLALAGGALMLFLVFNDLQGDAGLVLTEPLFDRLG